MSQFSIFLSLTLFGLSLVYFIYLCQAYLYIKRQAIAKGFGSVNEYISTLSREQEDKIIQDAVDYVFGRK